MVPVWLLLAVAVGFTGEGQGGGAEFGGVLLSVVSLAVPTVAVVLAVRAVRAGRRSGRSAVVVSGLELLGMGLGLPLLVVSAAPFLFALAIYLVCVAAVLTYARSHVHAR
jgi:hypothetical protein